jgi:hypothetical protein
MRWIQQQQLRWVLVTSVHQIMSSEKHDWSHFDAPNSIYYFIFLNGGLNFLLDHEPKKSSFFFQFFFHEFFKFFNNVF